ncbi:MAG: chemotaxis response regulator protein-glutamate methylesterase, partial [Promethearchaeota archaeon]
MPKKVLIASESAFRRMFLSEILSSHNNITIVDIARNAMEAINIIKKKTPEVLILDVEFDNEDWLNHFYPILKKCPINT